ATRSSKTVLSGPSIASTVTNSGSSTRALAMSNTSARTSPPCSVGIMDSHMGSLGPPAFHMEVQPPDPHNFQRLPPSLACRGVAQLSIQPNDCALRLRTLGRGTGRCGGLGHQLPNSVRHLSAFRNPVIDALAF